MILRLFRMGSKQILVVNGELLEKLAILYTSTKLEETQLLRNLDASKDHDHDLLSNDDFK